MRNRVGSLLIVDDNEINRDLLSRRLECRGYRVQTAESGVEGLKAVQRGDLDLVMLDVEMPEMSGLEVLSQIRKVHSPLQLPIIMVTGRTDSQDIVAALNLGANDYITKPVDVPVAVARISTHLSLKWTEEALHASEQRYALAARGANDGLWDWDLDTNEIYLSSRWKSMLGYEEHEIGSGVEEWFDRVHPADIDGLRAKLQEHLSGKSQHFECEHRIIHRDGAYRWMVNRGLAFKDGAGRATRMAGSQRDVTLEKIADPLTGLPNRVLFMDRLGCQLERAKRQKDYCFGVLSLTLDRFKTICDSLGPAIGDKLLVALSKRLESCLRSADTLARSCGAHTVARISGDEFSILLDDIKSLANATRVAERLLEELEAPFDLEGREVFVSAYIGIALNMPGDTEPEDLLQHADTAMNWAKATGKTHYEVFNLSMRDQALVRLQLETELRRALEREELENYYQIIVSVTTGQIVGFESLIRWRHPTQGIVSPGAFIPLAEETGLILEIDQKALQTACRQLRAWQERYGDLMRWVMCTNLSAKQFITNDLVERIVQVLNDTGLDPRCLKVEVTESLIMQDMAFARSVLHQLKKLGLHVALDDFGTGYSSLSYLQSFPIDTLKIDQSFVGRMDGNSDNSAMVATIIAMAHNLGLDVVAEGVETAEQLRVLESLGCEYAQGFYLGRPMKAEAIESVLAGLGNTHNRSIACDAATHTTRRS
jgi:diguanylate cyclase (GGDEF)-like protein/PAS domain S-box-containing protein